MKSQSLREFLISPRLKSEQVVVIMSGVTHQDTVARSSPSGFTIRQIKKAKVAPLKETGHGTDVCIIYIVLSHK